MSQLKLSFVRFVLFFGVLGGSVFAFAQVKPLVPTHSDLYRVRRLETRALNSTAIQNMNQRELKAMIRQADLPLDNPSNRLPGIDAKQVQSLINDLDFHPIVGFKNQKKYDPTGGIGYCFGRALYIHLLLLHLGVDDDAIRKIWAVGPINGGSITWGYHVATFVRSTEGDSEGWWVVDNFTGKTMNLTEWIEYMFRKSIDGKLRFYYSEPQKFGVSMGKYDPFQLGIYLPEERDVYRNYFTDIMSFFREKRHVGRYPQLEKELQESLIVQASTGVRLERGLLDEGPLSASRHLKSSLQLPLFETELFESMVAVREGLAPGLRDKRTCETTMLNSF